MLLGEGVVVGALCAEGEVCPIVGVHVEQPAVGQIVLTFIGIEVVEMAHGVGVGLIEPLTLRIDVLILKLAAQRHIGDGVDIQADKGADKGGPCVAVVLVDFILQHESLALQSILRIAEVGLREVDNAFA